MNSLQLVRSLSTSAARESKRNFKKFSMFEKRMRKDVLKRYNAGELPHMEHRFSRGVRQPYLPADGKEFVPDERFAKERAEVEPYPDHWKVSPNQSRNRPFVTRVMWEPLKNDPYEKEFIPEMVPELIVPDLEGFRLQPYVSYRVTEVKSEEFTPQDLFHAVYTDKIVKDFRDGKLKEDSSPLEPSKEEATDMEEARLRALRTGSDHI